VGTAEHVPALIRSLELAASPLVQCELAEALGRLRDSRADGVLLEMARGNGDVPCRVAAIHALGGIGSAETRGYLQMLTQDDSVGIRTAAVIQLGDVYLDADTAGTLARIASDDPDRTTRDCAIGYLKVFEKTQSGGDGK
jgi:HEAT repeat protein